MLARVRVRVRVRVARSLATLPPIPIPRDPFCNVSPQIAAKLGQGLHLRADHPLCIVRQRVEAFCAAWASERGAPPFAVLAELSPVVSAQQCFDDLLVPEGHVSRSKSDSYYLTQTSLLRTHTSAHQTELLAAGHLAFLCSGDVFRRDEIDATHYPVFHQMEGVRVFQERELAGLSEEQAKRAAEAELKHLLSGLARHLFGQDAEMRWRDDFFPFTAPSFELEVRFQDKWMEVLGCGVIHDQVLANARARAPVRSAEPRVGWAFGLGLERLAMVLFAVPDIRLFWSQDPRFLRQFRAGSLSRFVPYSKHPLCYKDVSFWLPASAAAFPVNDVYEAIRGAAGDLVERVVRFDEFVSSAGRVSHAYRIEYRHLDRSLTNEEVDAVQLRVRDALVQQLHVQLR